MMSITVVCDATTNIQHSVPNPLALSFADMYKLHHLFCDKFCYKAFCTQIQCNILSFYLLYRYGRAQMNHLPKYRPSNILSSRPVPALPTSNSWSHTLDVLYAASQLDLVDQSGATLIDIDRIFHAPSISADCMILLPYNNPK